MDKQFLRDYGHGPFTEEHVNKIIEAQDDSIIFKSDMTSNILFSLMLRVVQLEEDLDDWRQEAIERSEFE